MSNAEESYVFNKQLDKKILDLIKAYISESPHSATGSAFQESLYEIMQSHTNQTLQELKAKVDNKATEIENAIEDQKEENLPVPDWLKGQIHAYLNVLQLIDEAINE